MSHDNNRRQNRSKRRTFLKSTAGLAATTGIPTMVGSAAAADPKHEEEYEEALKVREETGKIEKFREHIRNHGGDVVASDKQFLIKRESDGSDGPSTDRVTHDDVSLRTTLSDYGNGLLYVDLEFDVKFSHRDGDKPKDPIGLGWEEREYDYDDYHYEADSVDWGQFHTHGVHFLYRDEDDDCFCEQTHNVGCRISREKGTPESRHVNSSFWHTWHDTELSSVSINSSGSVTFSLSDEEKKWESPAQDRVNEADAT
jgi:hypothetical protein